MSVSRAPCILADSCTRIRRIFARTLPSGAKTATPKIAPRMESFIVGATTRWEIGQQVLSATTRIGGGGETEQRVRGIAVLGALQRFVFELSPPSRVLSPLSPLLRAPRSAVRGAGAGAGQQAPGQASHKPGQGAGWGWGVPGRRSPVPLSPLPPPPLSLSSSSCLRFATS